MFELMISRFKFDKKPENFDVRTQIPSYYNVGMADVNKMAELVAQGYCWRNAKYNLDALSFKKEYAIGSHFVVLDFDSVEETPQKMSQTMTPNFWYYTLSQGVKPHHNYRMVWVLNKTIGPQQFEHVIEWFLAKFPKADRNAKDLTRMWYGGNGVYEVLNNDLFDVSVALHGFALRAQPSHRFRTKLRTVEANVGPNWEEMLDSLTDLWRLFKEGKACRAQRLLLIGNLKFIECDEKPVLQEILKYSDSPEEIYKWYEELDAAPISGGKTLAEHFNERLF